MSSFAKALSPALREIRILCCQSAQASAGTRQFIVSEYPFIKKHNPDLPVLIREATGTPARVFARFERGVEKHVELDDLSSSEVASKVAQLLSLS
ncbi:NDUFA2, NADH ubiquinone oxidoreductase 10.5kD subunit [Boletus edulis]|uniref:NDUFA2, NADH ubiquinone oxidoreductase 10.5kD subunit n=1 Tax=Boletus edulis BED1 TaxID=1328754 RepID=A0AAD4GHB7_BOLED|nr:NDUFA2, NADH ubiquinone oxidoreductase 10.5kD subunit [Boletus edulis]KAF8443925.1 NDUFA2, NADH ubiquinone oxidoreductase 10.5kD subunit [Boletus edulis BED1]